MNTTQQLVAAKRKKSDCITGQLTMTLDEDLSEACRGLIVTVAGNVAVNFPDGSTGVIPGLLPGFIHPISATRILTTGTTATGIKVYR